MVEVPSALLAVTLSVLLCQVLLAELFDRPGRTFLILTIPTFVLVSAAVTTAFLIRWKVFYGRLPDCQRNKHAVSRSSKFSFLWIGLVVTVTTACLLIAVAGLVGGKYVGGGIVFSLISLILLPIMVVRLTRALPAMPFFSDWIQEIYSNRQD